MDNLRRLVFTGVPDDCLPGLRPLAWRVILGSLPLHTEAWQSTMDANLSTYEEFKRELIVKPQLKASE